jgi:hypothetical protein
MQRLGLKTRDVNTGALRPANVLMQEALAITQEHKQGIDRTEASMVLFGRSVGEVNKLSKLNAEVMKEAREKAETLGLIITNQNVKSMKEYRAATNDMDDVFKALRKTIGDAVMPVFTWFAQQVASVGPAAVKVMHGAIASLVTIFWTLRAGIVQVWETLGAFLYSVTEPFMTFGRAIAKAFSGDFKGAAADFQGLSGRIADVWSGAMTRMRNASVDSFEKIKTAWKDTSGEAGTLGKQGSRTMGDLKNEKPKSRMAEWEAQLAEAKVAVERQAMMEGQYREMSKAQEKAFWEEKLRTQHATAEERVSLTRKIAEAELAINKERFEAEVAALHASVAEYRFNIAEKIRLEEQIRGKYQEGTKAFEDAQRRINALRAQDRRVQLEVAQEIEALRRETAKNEVAAEEDAARMAFELRQITNAQYIAAKLAFERRRYEIDLKALEDQIALAQQGNDVNIVELQKLYTKMEQMKGQHAQRMRDLTIQQTTEENKFAIEFMDGMTSGLQNTFETLFKKIGDGSLRTRDIVKSAFLSIGQEMMNVASKVAAHWLMTEIQKTVATVMQSKIRTTVEEGAAEESVLMSAWAALKNIMNNAWQAMAGAYQAIVGIPYVGPVLAPIAAGAAFAAVAGLAHNIASASGGFDIPRGVNPITQLHQEEMVLPATLANGVRRMVESGSEGGGMKVEAVHIHATDYDSFAAQLRRNPAAVAEALNSAIKKNGWRPS